MRKKLLYGLIGFLGAFLGLLFIAPYAIDWNDHKAPLIRLVEEKTGYSLDVAGDIGIRLLPVPTIHVEDVTLGNVHQAAETPMMTLKLLRVQLALGPLLSGQIAARSLRFEEPVVHLQRFPDGSNNWTVVPAASDGTAPDPQDLHNQESGEMIPLAISDIHIKAGRLSYHDAADDVVTAQNIDLDMTVQSIRGPFSGDATWRINGDATWRINATPLALDFSADVVSFDQPFAVDLTMRLPDADGQAHLRGDVDFSDWVSADPDNPAARGLKFSGRSEISGSSLATTLAAMKAALDPRFADQSRSAIKDMADHPYQLKGDLVIDGDDLTVNDMAIQLADLQASGGMNARLRDDVEIDLAMAFGRLGLDAVLAMITQSAESVDADAGLENQEKAADGSADNGSLTLRANLVSPAVLYRGKPIRDVVADVVFSGDLVRLTGLRASSPGGGRVNLSAAVDLSATRPAVRGNIAFQSDNLRPDLQWLGVDVDVIPGDRLRNFAIEADLKGDSKNLQLTDIDFNIDQSQGKAAAIVALGERPGLGLSFAIDEIDVDAYRPKKTHDGQGVSWYGWVVNILFKDWLDIGFDANLRGQIGSLRVAGIPTRELSLDLSLDRESLAFKEVSFADLAGLKADISGRIDGSDALPKIDLSVRASGTDMAASLKRLGAKSSPLMQRLGAVKVNGHLAGGPNEVRYKGVVEAAGGQLTLDGVAKSLLISLKIDAGFEGRFPSFTTAAGMLFPGYRPAGGDLGPLVVTGRLSGHTRDLDFSSINAQLGSINLQAEGNLNRTQDRPHLRANINTGAVVLDPFLPAPPKAKRHGYRSSPFLIKTATGGVARNPRWSPVPYDLSALRNLSMDIALSGPSLRYGPYDITSPQMSVTGDGNLLRLAPVSGSLFGGTIGLEAAFDIAAVPHGQMMLNWRGVDVETALQQLGYGDRAQGLMDVTFDVSGTGASPAAFIPSLAGRGQVIIQNPVLRGFNLGAIGQRLNDARGVRGILDILGAATAGGHTDFKTIEGDFIINNGVIREEQIDVISDAGTGAIKAIIDLPRYALDVHSRFSLAAPADAPPLVATAQGPIDRPTYKWVTKGFEEYLVGRGVQSLLDEFLPGFSGQPESTQSTQEGAKTPPEKPSASSLSEKGNQPPPAGNIPVPNIEDELRNMLKELLP